MSVSAIISADLRARSTFSPACPLCSHLGHEDIQDIVRWPSIRGVRLTVNRHRDVESMIWKFDTCCAEYRTDAQFESFGDAVTWWRKARLEPVRCVATNNRRISTLSKLQTKGLEPIT